MPYLVIGYLGYRVTYHSVHIYVQEYTLGTSQLKQSGSLTQRVFSRTVTIHHQKRFKQIYSKFTNTLPSIQGGYPKLINQ